MNNDNQDLRDSARDEARLRADQARLDLPEVRDIPGQENIKVPPLGELADTIISSDDEEGRGILEDINQSRQDPDRDISAASHQASDDIDNDPDSRADADSDDLDEGELARFESGDRP